MASLVKVGKIWYARRVYYENGKRKEQRESLETQDEKTAKRRLTGWVATNESNRWGDTRVNFEDAKRKFLSSHVDLALEENTQVRYRVSLAHLSRFFEGRDIKSIKKADLMAFEIWRRKQPGRNGIGKVTTTTIRRDLLCLSSLMTFCILMEWIEVNPVPAFLKQRKSSGLKDLPPRNRYLTEDEEQRGLAQLRIVRNPRDAWDAVMRYAFVVAQLDIGGRNDSELLQLEWPRVQLGVKPHVVFDETKGDKARRVPLLDRVSDVLSALPIHPTSKYVFHKRNGKPYKSMRPGILSAFRRAGIDDITEHDFRRTCGCRLLQKHKRSLEEVQLWLGHASIKTTQQHYAFLEAEGLDEIVEADTARRAEQQAMPSAEIVHMRRKG